MLRDALIIKMLCHFLQATSLHFVPPLVSKYVLEAIIYFNIFFYVFKFVCKLAV